MLSAAAQGYLKKKDYKTALNRVKESIGICFENDFTSELGYPLQLATQILDKSDDAAGKKFLIALLKESGDKIKSKKTILDVLGKQLLYGGDLVFSMTVFREKWRIVKKENPESI